MDEVFSMFFTTGDKHSPFSDFDDFIKILEGDNDKRTRKMFRDLGKGYRPRGGRAGLAAKKQQTKHMKHLEKQMMNGIMGGGMEEMMMMAMMMDTDMPEIDDFEEFEKMMNGKSGKGKVPGMTKDEIKMMEMMEQMLGGKPKKAKNKSDDEWQTDSDDEPDSGAK